MTALHYAVCLSFVEPASLLLKHNADVRLANNEGFTAMHFACQHGLPDMVFITLAGHSQRQISSEIGLPLL